MVDITEEPHRHLADDDGRFETELVGNYKTDEDEIIPLSIIQGNDTVWLSRDQAEALADFIKEKVLV